MGRREQTYYTYIVASASRTLYIGVTNNLVRRIQEHKDGTFGSFTAKYRCHRLVWFESYSWIDKAIAREKELKGWLRAKKIALIQQNNPTWVDLSEEWGTLINCPQKEEKAGPSLLHRQQNLRRSHNLPNMPLCMVRHMHQQSADTRRQLLLADKTRLLQIARSKRAHAL